MRCVYSALALMLAVSCTDRLEASECAGVLQPPPQYDHAPLIPVMIIIGPREEVSAECARLTGVDNPRACTVPPNIIRIPAVDNEGVSRTEQHCLLTHEFGHVNGWSKQHEGGAYL